MSIIQRLLRPRPDPKDALRPLWAQVVAEARDPAWYAERGVADTLEGRFEMIVAVLSLVLARMDREERLAEPAVRLTELFVDDMDGQLRELGVGDVVVGKHMGRLMGAMGGRMKAYRSGLAAGGEDLSQAVERNMHLAQGADPEPIAEALRELAERLDTTGDDELLRGEIAQKAAHR